MHIVEGASGRKPDAHPVGSPDVDRGLRHFQKEPRAVLDRAAVGVGALIAPVAQELVEKVPVGPVDLDAVKAGVQRVFGPGAVLGDDAGNFREIQRARRDKRFLTLRRLHLAFGRDRRRGDRKVAVRLEKRMRNAPDMPELQENPGAGAMHGLHHRLPALHLIGRVDAGRIRIAHAARRDLRRFGDEEPRRGALAVVKGRQLRRDVAGARAAARHRRQHDPVRKRIRPKLDGRKEGFHKVSIGNCRRMRAGATRFAAC